jgi:hypothetical protein
MARGSKTRLALVALPLLLVGGRALAQSSPSAIPISSAAIVELRFNGVPPALEEQVRVRLRQALNLEGYKVVEEKRAQQQLRDEGAPPGCVVGPCLTRVTRGLKVERAVVGGVRGQGTSYELTLSLLETGGGSLLAQVNARCDVCSFKELEDSIARATTQLHKQSLVYLSTRSQLKVGSAPPGADVLLDDLLVGQTPLSHVATPGVHTLEVAFRGRGGVKQEVALGPGKTRIVHVDLGRFAPPPSVGSLAPRRIPRWLVWSTLGAGAALCGAGAGLWALDGRETSDPRYLHDTRGAGIALVSVGATAIATSALLYLLDLPTRRLAVASGGAGRRAELSRP